MQPPPRRTNSNKRLWVLLLVLAIVLLGHRVSFDDGRLAWRPFGVPRHSFVHQPCGVPIHVALGEVDPRFGFDRPTVARAMVEAAALWQAAGDATLFVDSEHSRAMSVSLEFDERQQNAKRRHSLRGSIDNHRAQLASDELRLARWGQRIEATRSGDDRDREAWLVRAREHAAQLHAWNEGAAHTRTEARRGMLEREGIAIHAAGVELERARAAFNQQVAEHNQRALERRRQAEEFRGRIAEYNAHASDDPVESGRYSYDREHGRRIGVFRAADYNELVWILAHEYGHALGLDHVEAPRAVMNALLHEGGGAPAGRARAIVLDDADRAAIRSLCGDRLRRRG